MTFARFLTISVRQAVFIRRLIHIIERQVGHIGQLERQVEQVRADAELLLELIPDDRKRDACALIRDRHRIAHLNETATR